MINIYSADERYNLHLTCCYIAVREAFPFLSIREIINAKRGQFDAQLARQIVVHLMANAFNWPKMRIAKNEGRSKMGFYGALHTIDDRLDAPRFAVFYRRIQRRALCLAAARMAEAA